MTSGKGTRITFRVLSTTLAFFVNVDGRLLSQTAGPQEQSPQEQEIRLTVGRISNPKLPMSQRVADYGELTKLEPKKRNPALRIVVSNSDESIAAMAAAALIRDRVPNVTDLLVPRISQWSEGNQAVVLEAIRFVGDDQTFLDVPRELIKNLTRFPAVDKKAVRLQSPLDSAALILATSSDPSDRSLIRNALVSHPLSRGLWLATASLRELNSHEIVLAASIYRDQEVPLEVRVAAASSLDDTNASAFAIGEIKSFISRFNGREMGELLNAALSDQREKRELYYFRDHLIVLGTLRFLKTPDAESLTFDFLASRNEDLRETLGLVAAARWPERLLATGQGLFAQDEYENLLAYLSVLHPELTASILARVAKPRLDAILARLGSVGVVGVFGLPAAIALR